MDQAGPRSFAHERKEVIAVKTKDEATEFLAGKRIAVTGVSRRVWMHRAFGRGSVSAEAAEYGRQHGISVIDGGCPCRFEPTADPGHKAMRVLSTLTGKLPREV
jgi:uncharacterized protein